jgi:anti-anti-sigma factor
MQIEQKLYKDHWIILAIQGAVDSTTAPLLELACQDVLQRKLNLAIDLSGVSFLSSAGLRVLLNVIKGLGLTGSRFALLQPPSLVQEVLNLSGFAMLFPVIQTVDQLR